MSEEPNKSEISNRQFLVILAVVLVCVVLGTLFTMKFEGPRPSGKRTALGHFSNETPEAKAAEMAWIPGGTLKILSRPGVEGAIPERTVRVDGFWIDRAEVTNLEFDRFVSATAYVTTAEQPPNPTLKIPGLGTNTVPGSFVLAGRPTQGANGPEMPEWTFVPGANWRHPEGPGSSIEGREKHPVVHVSWLDAMAYANWAKKRLPSETEWELAARGGMERQQYVWGNELDAQAGPAANVAAHHRGTPQGESRVAGTLPVASFPPNRFGLYDMAGNVWEWCSDWYRADGVEAGEPGSTEADPKEDPSDPPTKVIRGGSYLSHDPGELRVEARRSRSPYASYSDVGFRCARSAR